MTDNNIYTSPQAELNIESSNTTDYLFFPTSQLKLLMLFIATFGLYSVYWFYKNWKLQKQRHHENISPVLRAIFYIFFTHKLFYRIENQSIKQSITIKWSASFLATLFVSLIIISNFSDTISGRNEEVSVMDYISLLILFVVAYILYKVQNVINHINGDIQGKINSTFSLYNIIFLILGSIVWFLVIVGLFALQFDFLTQLLR